MKTYRVKDWGHHYETAETRKLVNLRWLPVPNKHDGLGFRRIAAQKDACELFTAWILILQVASKGRGPEERGNLLRGQEVLGDEDLAMMTGFPKEIFTRALEFFSNPKQGWLLVHEDELPLSAGEPAESAGKAGASPAVWNGMEWNGSEGKEGSAEASPASQDEWLEGLVRNPAYDGIDVKVQFEKMKVWCKEHRKEPTRRRFVNWLNRCDKPITQGGRREGPGW